MKQANTVSSKLTAEQVKALGKVPSCVELGDMDGTWKGLVFRVECPVANRSNGGRGYYTKREATACIKWLERYAPESRFAKATRGVGVKLLNGSSIAHVGTVSRMGDPHDVTVIVESQGMTFEAWDLERHGEFFVAPSWKRLS